MMKSHHNMGKNERITRIILGLVMSIVGLFGLSGFVFFSGVTTTASIVGFTVAIVGIVLFATGLFAWCPLNALMHWNSCPTCKIGDTHTHHPI